MGNFAVGSLSNSGTTRVGKAKDFGDFIKTFADGVIAGGADDFKMVMLLHKDNLGVTARDNESEERKLNVGRVQPVGINVGFKMMNRKERLMV